MLAIRRVSLIKASTVLDTASTDPVTPAISVISACRRILPIPAVSWLECA